MNNNNNNQNEYNNKLYNSVFNNIVIKRIILNHLTKYNILNNDIYFYSIEEWDQFKYKDYLNKVSFYEFDLNKIQLPDNINQIKIPIPPSASLIEQSEIIRKLYHVKSILFWRKLQMLEFESPYIRSIISTSKLNTLRLSIYNLKEFNSNTIPQSITDLELELRSPCVLINSILPRALKKLKFCNLTSSIQDQCLPDSLTQVGLSSSNPYLINQLSSHEPLVKLHYYDKNETINNDIKLPNSLQHLTMHCYSFNSTLPNSLTSLDLETVLIREMILPTLNHLEFNNFVVPQDIHIQPLPINVKSIEYYSSSKVNLANVTFHQNQLKKLSIYRLLDQPLLINQAPSSLTHLYLGSPFNKVIGIGVLPPTLLELSLGYQYTQVINPLAIPQQLKSLIIYNDNYNHQIELTPSTHPYTIISCSDLNLYYQASNTDIRVLELPRNFKLPLSTLQLQDKSNLEYLKLNNDFDYPIELSDLPINNKIKTLEFGFYFSKTINLEYFQNLETLIINPKPIPNIITTTTTSTDNNDTIYNNYNLKNIIISSSRSIPSSFIGQLNSNFYQFLKLNK